MQLTERQESDWLTATAAQNELPAQIWPLICRPDSLTDHLRSITNNEIEHRLLSANWGHAISAEKNALTLKKEERTWVRSIEWRYQNSLWAHARAIFPESTIEATGNLFPSLGVQSVGEVLFKDSSCKRSEFLFSLLDKRSGYYAIIPELLDHHDVVCARRSIIRFQGYPILIVEIFIPEHYAQFKA